MKGWIKNHTPQKFFFMVQEDEKEFMAGLSQQTGWPHKSFMGMDHVTVRNPKS
jgi:hypothetical protein